MFTSGQSIFYNEPVDDADVYHDWSEMDLPIDGFEDEVAVFWDGLTPMQKRTFYPFTLYDDGNIQYNDNDPAHIDCDTYCSHQLEFGICDTDPGWKTYPGRYSRCGEAEYWLRRYGDKKSEGELKESDLPPAYHHRKFCHLEERIRERIVEKYVCQKGYVPQPVPCPYDDYREDINLPNWSGQYNGKEVQDILMLSKHTLESHNGGSFNQKICICNEFDPEVMTKKIESLQNKVKEQEKEIDELKTLKESK